MTTPFEAFEPYPVELPIQPSEGEYGRVIPLFPENETDISPSTTQTIARGGSAVAVTSAASYDFLPLIALGEKLKDSGLNGWLAAGIIATATAVETTAVSYVATATLGSVSYEPKTRVGKAMMRGTPLVSLWRGAPTGVTLDALRSDEPISLRRRLAHGIPYGLAIGFWVSPNPLSENAIGGVKSGLKYAYDTVINHPEMSAGAAIATGAIGALAMRRNRRAAIHEQAMTQTPSK